MGAGSPKSSLSCLDRVQRRMRWLIGDNLFKTLQPLSHRRNVASLSLLYRYYSGKCSEELNQLVPPPKVFGKDTRLAVHTRQNHPHALRVPDSMKYFHADSVFPRTVKLLVGYLRGGNPPPLLWGRFDDFILKTNISGLRILCYRFGPGHVTELWPLKGH